MKKAILLSVVFWTALSCCSSKKTAAEDPKNSRAQILTPCPENSDCALEVHRGKGMAVKNDAIGAVYYELEDNSKKTTYHYTCKLKTDDQYQDAGYREEVIFEMDNSNTDLELTDTELQNAKMLFGVWCYCKGKAGNYKIAKGNFSKKGKEITIDFPAIVADQKVTELRIRL